MKLQTTVAIAFIALAIVVALVLLAKGCQDDGPSSAVICSSQQSAGPGAGNGPVVSESRISRS